MNDTVEERADGEIPWKPPVISAIAGALVVGSLVIFALVNGPVDDPEADALILAPVPSLDVPNGYTLMTNDGDVGLKVESMTSDGGSSTVVVSSAVRGTTEPADSPPPDVAYWEMQSDGESTVMDIQFTSESAVGTTTIVFPVSDAASEPIVAAYPTASVVSESTTMEVGPDALGEPIAFGLGFEPDIAISGELVVGDGWGTVEWTSPDGMVATLDVVVTLVGTGNPDGVSHPIRLVPGYDSSLAGPDSVIVSRPLYGFGGSYGLYGDGRVIADGGPLTSIVIELEGTVVTETADALVLTFDPAGD
ncbi:MAG: hypothetical protein M3092_08745 [Actinomycetia bacterium]|nr:hypothetical protein [Actinomycetes bacterium]